MANMSAPLKLPDAGDGLANVAAIRDALSERLLGGNTDRAFAFSVEADDGSHGAPAWTDPTTGDVHISQATAEALGSGELDAVLAIAHALVHSIGYGPAFAQLEGQLLEEAITETLAQCYVAPIAAAFGLEVADPPPLFAGVANGADIAVTRITAANVSVERFGRLAAWLEGYDDGDADPDELETAALKWALRLKATPGEKRFEVLAEEAAALDEGDAGDDVEAALMFEDYLRGYMKQLERSGMGFAGLRYAAARCWLDGGDEPTAIENGPRDDWRQAVAEAEAITLAPLPQRGQIGRVLAAAPPEVLPAVKRSLDARAMLWAARHLDASRISAQK